MAIQIDPVTGERVGSQPQIDPATGERVAEAPVAGAGPLGLPQPAAHPAVNMQSSPLSPSLYGKRLADTAASLAKPLAHIPSQIMSYPGFVDPSKSGGPIQDITQNPDKGEGIANAITDTGTGVATGAALGHAGPALETIGEGMQGKGIKLINNTVGATAPDFKRGANPGRGYFDAGIGPSSSLRSIANKAAAAKNDVGANIGSAVDSATASGITLPPTTVAQRLQAPLGKAFDLETGPGGGGNTAPLENYSAGFRPAIQDATAAGGFTPRGLFDLKQGISQNTAWTDPSQFNLKAVRQQQSGALSGLLGEAVPEIKPLNQQYQDLGKLSNRAASRADTGSMPLSKLGKLGAASLLAGGAGFEGHGPAGLAAAALPVIADSVPVRTTAASGLFYGGKGVASAGAKVRGLFGPK